jgi:group II intron reverse transcriptase/maturase
MTSAVEETMTVTKRILEPLSTKLQRIARRAQEEPIAKFSSLSANLTLRMLREAYSRVRKDGAAGIDEQTAKQYAENLEENLRSLRHRIRTNKYRAPAVKRVWIPKEGGERPIGIPTFEDKIVQRAVHMLLEPIYEQDFQDCSYGFRKGRNAHKALKAIREQCMNDGIEYIIDADIKSYFDSINHAQLREILQQRVSDGGILRLIGKWLKAGVLENGQRYYPEDGTPQGGVISPLLANIFLDYVLDRWFVEVVQPRMKGKVFLVRYADDFVIGCQYQEDAGRIMEVLPKRMEKYKLTIHPEKTRLINFSKPRGNKRNENTFDFLGFTLYWSKSQRGYWVIKLKTAKKRVSRFMKRVGKWCKENRHQPLNMQYHKLKQMLRGYFNYFGVTCNSPVLWSIRYHTLLVWHKWLSRRGARKRMLYERFYRCIAVRFPLPKPYMRSIQQLALFG